MRGRLDARPLVVNEADDPPSFDLSGAGGAYVNGSR